MKITVNFDDGEKVIVYGMTPLDFALAVSFAYQHGWYEFQTKEELSYALRTYNQRKMIE
jgi:hypothetical protein